MGMQYSCTISKSIMHIHHFNFFARIIWYSVVFFISLATIVFPSYFILQHLFYISFLVFHYPSPNLPFKRPIQSHRDPRWSPMPQLAMNLRLRFFCCSCCSHSHWCKCSENFEMICSVHRGILCTSYRVVGGCFQLHYVILVFFF